MKISRPFYLNSYLVGYIAGLICLFGFGLLLGIRGNLTPAAAVMAVLGTAALLYVAVVWLVFVYKIWSHLPAEHARTTPGKAMGFLFIPVVNLYWMFQAYWGWMKDYNAMADRRDPELHRMPAGLALAMCIVDIAVIPLNIVPVVGLAAAIAGIVLTALFINSVCKGINALGEASPERLYPEGSAPPEVLDDEPMEAKRTSGMAIASLVLGILAFGTYITAIPGLILGVVGITTTGKRQPHLQGRGLAIAGTVVSGAALLLLPLLVSILLPALAGARQHARTAVAMSHLKQLSMGMRIYQEDHRGMFPPPGNWEALLAHYIADEALAWPGDYEGGRVWAMNSHLENMGDDWIREPWRTVMLFEARPGSPLFGGAELLPERPRGRGGVLVLFVDGHVEVVPPAGVERLIWNPRG